MHHNFHQLMSQPGANTIVYWQDRKQSVKNAQRKSRQGKERRRNTTPVVPTIIPIKKHQHQA
eukprot:2360739-Ditylum_brightwellii.AAC.1